jgi:hypothetical protein
MPLKPIKWKWIPGYEGRYKVSDTGLVKLLTRDKHKVMKPSITRKGYLIVCLSKNGERKTYLVHRLVLLAFVGPCPPGMECRHRNGCPAINRLSNLSWSTPKENQADRRIHGTRITKLTESQVYDIRERYANSSESGETIRDIAKEYPVSFTTICDIVLRKSWQHI